MKPVSAMPTGQRYICLNTTLMNETLNLLAPSSFALFNTSCSLETICGMTPFRLPGVPDQVVRFATPLALHTGIIHLFLDGAILLIISVKLEQAINSLRTSRKTK
jgi:membrane associated rhomboid family serine protease